MGFVTVSRYLQLGATTVSPTTPTFHLENDLKPKTILRDRQPTHLRPGHVYVQKGVKIWCDEF